MLPVRTSVVVQRVPLIRRTGGSDTETRGRSVAARRARSAIAVLGDVTAVGVVAAAVAAVLATAS